MSVFVDTSGLYALLVRTEEGHSEVAAAFRLLNEIHASKSSYVCRIRDNSVYKVLQERTLSEEARAAGIDLAGAPGFG